MWHLLYHGSRGVPVELFVTGTGTGIFGENFAGTDTGTGIFRASTRAAR